MKNINLKIITLFNAALKNENSKSIEFSKVQSKALKLGYLVHPDICNEEIMNWLDSQFININSTFYKNWNDVFSKSRFELYIDQILHYSSTYGTNYQGKVFTQNDNNLSFIPEFSSYKFINAITEEDLYSKCKSLLTSGIALKQETIEDVLEILDSINKTIDVNEVKNKEARVILFSKLNQVPNNNIEFIRYIVYLATGETLLIQNQKTVSLIKLGNDVDLSSLVEKFGYNKLAESFLQFKIIFLAFKTNVDNSKCVNKLRKLAIKFHKPTKKGLLDEILINSSYSLTELRSELDKVTNFKKVQLLQAILVRQKQLDYRMFPIRNSKMYIKEGQAKMYSKGNYNVLYSEIYNHLVNSIKSKKCTIKIPEGIDFKIPLSEKSFVGNYPLGTSFKLDKENAIVGIHWKDIDGADDLDLSLIDINENRLGWNSNFTNDDKTLMFSGDMTVASPEATELFYAKKGFSPSIVKVNLYRGDENSKFKLFLAKEKISSLSRGYMVNPNNVLFTIDMEMDVKEKSLGIITENEFIISSFKTGNSAISSSNSKSNKYLDYVIDTIDCFVSLNQVLWDAGFSKVEENPDLDLSNVTKDSLISIFS